MFHYNRDFAKFPFRRLFDYYYFWEHNRLFRRELDYQILTTFLRAVNSASFLFQHRPMRLLYPLEIANTCPFSIYKNAPGYVLEEELYINKELVRRSLQHPVME